MRTEDRAQVRDALRRMLADEIAPHFATVDVPAQRAVLDAMGAQAEMPAGVTVEPTMAAGRPAEWLRPTHRARRVVLYVHGGGFVMGSCQSHRALAANVGVACRAAVLLPEYRLAPEHPFPAGLDDLVDAWRGLLSDGWDATDVIIAGDSAGGGLAASLVLAAAARGLPRPGALVLLSPFADLTLSGASLVTRAARDPWLRADVMAPIRDLYLAGADPAHPWASPVFADLSVLPPTLIQVGDDEILLSDAERLAARAAAAGVAVQLEVAPALWHVWQFFAPALPDAVDALGRIGAFVDRCLARRAA